MTTNVDLDSAQTQTDKELNFNRLREKADRLERENQELGLALKQRARATQNDLSASLLKEAGINHDEPFVETSKLPELIAAVTRHTEEKTQQIVSQALNEYQTKNMFTYMQAETGGQFSKTVTDEALKKLQEEEPEIMIAISALENDPAAKASFLYKKCLRIKEREESVKKAKDRIGSSMRMHNDYHPTAEAVTDQIAAQELALQNLAPRGTKENIQQIREMIAKMPKTGISLSY